MKVLYSKKKVKGFKHKIFYINDVYCKLDGAAVSDHKFKKALSESLDKQGMLWPPIVWKQDVFLLCLNESGKRHDPDKPIEVDQSYRVAIGNNRFHYAKENEYTHIECVIAEMWRDRDTILAQTEMEYRKDY
jgi:hypothetical protein